MEGRRSLHPHDETMTWILISIPVMLLAVAIAVLPVLLMSVSEARRGFALTSDLVPMGPAAAPVNAFDDGGAGELVQKAA
jgi:flagellar basal body-associated protein FliL